MNEDRIDVSARASPLRILLVENHADTRTTLTMFLTVLGHEVRAAASIEEALALLAAQRPQVLLSDIGLPDGDGWELLERVPDRGSLFAIAMSGFGMAADRERSAAAGYRFHLVKPIALEQLEEALAAAAREVARPGQDAD